jgi:hypothetical protein
MINNFFPTVTNKNQISLILKFEKCDSKLSTVVQ